jgi:glycosyltransferase involved in cell wall biosynthesis
MIASRSDRSPNHPLRVIVYTDSRGIGGAEISLGHLVKTVSHAIEIIVMGVSATVVDYIADRRPQAKRKVLSNHGITAFSQHLFQFIQLRPDIIHFNLCTPWAGAIGLEAALLLPNSRVVRVDQLPLRTTDAYTFWRTRLLCLRVDAHIAVGEASARRMEDFYALGRKSVLSIPNGVPEVVSSNLLFRSNRKEMIVGSIGRLDAMKAHDVLLQAIAQVEGTQAVILGDGEQRSALVQFAEVLGVSDRVKFMGWVESPQNYLPSFDVVALPSRSEGFPLAMVEAMLAARPVIATRVGSMPEAVIDQKTGILIEKNDVLGLADALKKLRDFPSFRQRLGRQAYHHAIANFTVYTMTSKYERLWKEVVNKPRSQRLWVSRPRD